MKHSLILFLLISVVLGLKAQTAVTLNLPSACLVTGLDDIETLNFHVSPNPATNRFQLSIDASGTIEKARIKIFTSQGKLVFDQQVYSEYRTLVKTVNTESLSGGLYLISVQRNEDVYTKTIVLNK